MSPIPYIFFIFLSFLSVVFAIHNNQLQFLTNAFPMLIFLGLAGVIPAFYAAFSGKDIKIHPALLITAFFSTFLYVCISFASVNNLSLTIGIQIFFFVSFLLAIIALFWICIYYAGKTCINKSGILKDVQEFHTIASLTLGFFILFLCLFILAALGWYNIYGLMLLFFIMTFLASPSFLSAPIRFFKPLYIQELGDTKQKSAFIINSLIFLFICLYLSINFFSIYRPFPIGWDDLGAYMNYPKLITDAGGLISLGKMYTWELYTGIGYILGNPTFAFFLNSFSGVIAAGVIYLGFKAMRKQSTQSAYSYPLLASFICILMPMSVFQLAMDMKLDFGLLFVSMSAIFLSYYAIFSKDISFKDLCITCFLVGVFAVLAFTIKLTSLLLIVSLICVFCYKKGGIWLYFASIFFFFAFMTFAELWHMMNVIFPKDSFFIAPGLLLCSFACITAAYVRKDLQQTKTLLVSLLCMFFGALLAFSPWAIKNIQEISSAQQTLSLGGVLSGVSERPRIDYTVIHSPEYLDSIQKNQQARGIDQTGTTSNEDFGRYFGYEGGVNNYLKLPWNLTFQVNQGGEFTNITFLYFVILPSLLFVFVFRQRYLSWILFFVGSLSIMYMMPGPLSNILTEKFSHIHLPFGYIIIGIAYMTLFLFAHNFLQKEQSYYKQYVFLLAFGSIYVYLWAISAFGIVWYGIVMYGIFLGLMCAGLHQSEENKYNLMPYFVFAIVFIYLIGNGFSHMSQKIHVAQYLDYKTQEIEQKTATFAYNSQLYNVALPMNIHSEAIKDFELEMYNKVLEEFSYNTELSTLFRGSGVIALEKYHALFFELLQSVKQGSQELQSVKLLQEKLYGDILSPRDAYRDTHLVYRVGTFFMYYITENHRRVVDDSLLNTFDTYIWDEDPKITKERLMKLNFKHMLIDLNAATIDKDERQALTKRYTNMLSFLLQVDDNIIATDSICLSFARDMYKSEIFSFSLQDAINMAGLNYGTAQERSLKTQFCAALISEEIYKNLAQEKSRFSYLQNYHHAIKNALNGKDYTLDDVYAIVIRNLQRGSFVYLQLTK